MINSLWISKTGMEAQQMQLDVISNNLANVSTNGFKKSHAVFEDLMYQNLRQVGTNTSEQSTLPTGLQVGLGVRAVATSRSFAQGNLQQTSNNLDIAIQGNGFFQLTMPDGTIGYTRDGAFQIDNQGRMVNSGGLPLSGGITVPANATAISVSPDGTVSASIPGSTAPQNIGTIALASFINPPGLEPKGQNIYAESAASGQPNAGTAGANGLGTLMQGFVETSNVNVVQELVTMIQTQRAYEMNSKAIQTSDQMLQKLGQL
ncbi:flagellar basal-body rod protein FlgG [Rhodoferax sp. AJA081-3]|uniref:flagellar basal-body rod protein FlgG n=1 Tax=Rhodoferax sp. AJA081-3 TaxID=2752316 RepID=UPI001ADFC4D8|nr:flagellar basal-body rod protein FlgG [Rhodoferax sp. AJA081-3]QTN30285.1 flagellar basal-body rod protein FlgG [Rhodoferax sp. AJA081-3]